MIPKVIHYCWFGGSPLPEEYARYIDSWKQFCPDYEIKRWDESNFDVNSCDFVKEAYEKKRWAFVSDYARLKIIYDEGGVYLDTDVELVRNIDRFLVHKCFLAEESTGYINTGLGFGAERNNPVVGKMLEEYKGHFLLNDGSLDTIPCPRKNTAPLLKMGYKYNEEKIWFGEDVTVYPPNYFCPIDYESGQCTMTEETYSIHHFSASWKCRNDLKIAVIRKFCVIHFGKAVGVHLARFLDFPFRVKGKFEMLGFVRTFQFVIKKYFTRHQ